MRTHGRPVRDLVRRRPPVVARPEETAQAAAARMAEEACCSVLVCDGDRLCGLFTERDLVTRVVGRGLDPTETRLARRCGGWTGPPSATCRWWRTAACWA